MKTYYELIGVEAGATSDEIKKAFRVQIARYHPDKVQHLGAEFQEIASTRAAELTEAYRVLMDGDARRKYDDSLAAGPARAPHAAAATPGGDVVRPAAPAPAEPVRPADPRQQAARATSDQFVRKAALAMLREAVTETASGAAPWSVTGFDAGFEVKQKRALFGKGEPALRLLARFVDTVDVNAMEETWRLAPGNQSADQPSYVLVMGTGVAPAADLAAAVAEQRRKLRKPGPVLIPVDVRDWTALLPPETPAHVRAVLQRLKAGKR